MIYTFFIKILLITTVFSLHFPKPNIRILRSPIFPGIPQLKLHHSIFISTTNYTVSYVVDFSPINQSMSAMTKLLFAQNIPAEIRIRKIDTMPNYYIDDMIIQHWHSINAPLSYSESKTLSDQTYDTIKNIELKQKMSKIFDWDINMNLYTHNCQHFGKHVTDIFDE